MWFGSLAIYWLDPAFYSIKGELYGDILVLRGRSPLGCGCASST